MSADIPRESSSLQMIDVAELSRITGLSRPTIWRYHESGAIPRGFKIGSTVRWRLRTGDPGTGIEDWLNAGCPSRQIGTAPISSNGKEA